VARRRAIVALTVLALVLVAGGAALAASKLSLGSGRSHAKQSVKIVARAVPREKRYRVSACKQAGASKVRCTYTVAVKALSGGTITCTGKVLVTRPHGKHPVLRSSFPGKPRCKRGRR
jgi:hypothetical protein